MRALHNSWHFFALISKRKIFLYIFTYTYSFHLSIPMFQAFGAGCQLLFTDAESTGKSIFHFIDIVDNLSHFFFALLVQLFSRHKNILKFLLVSIFFSQKKLNTNFICFPSLVLCFAIEAMLVYKKSFSSAQHTTRTQLKSSFNLDKLLSLKSLLFYLLLV